MSRLAGLAAQPRTLSASVRNSLRWKRRCSSRTWSASSGIGPCTASPGTTSLIAVRAPEAAARPARRANRATARRRSRTRSAKAHPAVRGGAHRAMLPRGEHGRRRPLLGCQFAADQARQLNSGAGMVTAGHRLRSPPARSVGATVSSRTAHPIRQRLGGQLPRSDVGAVARRVHSVSLLGV